MLPTNLPAPGAPRDGARVLTPGARRALNLLGIFAAATTLVPTPVPVQKKKSSDTANLDLGLGLGLPLSFIFVTAIILGLYYRKQQLEKSDAGAGVGTPEDGFMAAPGDAPLAIEEDHIQLETAVHPGTGIPLVLEC